MTVYIVTIRPGTSDRYTDSIWIDEYHAGQRVADLVQEFRRRGNSAEPRPMSNEWAAWVTTATVPDGSLAQARRLPSAAGKDGSTDGGARKKAKS